MKLGLNHISASGHIGFGKYGGLIEAPASAPSKNYFRMFWSTCMPNFMLVDKSAQSSPLEPGLSSVTIFIICVYAVNRNNHAKLYLPSTFNTKN